MTRDLITATGPMLLVLTCLAGCAAEGGSGMTPGLSVAAGKHGLSSAEVDAVTLAAREMTGDVAAEAHGLTALRGGKPGVHVCGYVKTAVYAGLPLYVELGEHGGVVKAQRGQVGGSAQNLAKVRFMCRAHGA